MAPLAHRLDGLQCVLASVHHRISARVVNCRLLQLQISRHVALGLAHLVRLGAATYIMSRLAIMYYMHLCSSTRRQHHIWSSPSLGDADVAGVPGSGGRALGCMMPYVHSCPAQHLWHLGVSQRLFVFATNKHQKCDKAATVFRSAVYACGVARADARARVWPPARRPWHTSPDQCFRAVL